MINKIKLFIIIIKIVKSYLFTLLRTSVPFVLHNSATGLQYRYQLYVLGTYSNTSSIETHRYA